MKTALDSIDKVRNAKNTFKSAFKSTFLIRVMGRHTGFMALNAAAVSAADKGIVPEGCNDINQELDNIIEHLYAVYS